MARAYAHEHFATSTDWLPQSRQVEASRQKMCDKRTMKKSVRLPQASLPPACSSCSHSEASLAAHSLSPVTGGLAVLPTSVVARKPRTAWLHRAAPRSWCCPSPAGRRCMVSGFEVTPDHSAMVRAASPANVSAICRIHHNHDQ